MTKTLHVASNKNLDLQIRLNSDLILLLSENGDAVTLNTSSNVRVAAAAPRSCCKPSSHEDYNVQVFQRRADSAGIC